MLEGIDRSPVAGMARAWMRATPPRLASVALVVAARSRVVAASAGGRARALAMDARGRLPAWAARLTYERAVTLLATALSIGACAWYAAHGDTLAYPDAVGHLMIARRVLISPTPGLGQLGPAWPPFSHILMLPFVWIGPLYRSGLAGAIPSMVGYILATLYLFRSARLLFASVGAGWVAAALFALNPNLLYLQSTPMTELVLLGAIILGLFYLFRWVETERPLDLVICAAAFAAGTLVRYDAWALAAAELPVIAFITWRRHGRKSAEGVVWLYSILAFAGGAAWFLYNWVIFGDPLYFMDGPYSARYQQATVRAAGGLPTYHNLPLSLHEYLQAATNMDFWPLLALAALGLVVTLARFRFSGRMLPVYVVWTLLAFNVLSLYLGITIIYTPQVYLPHMTMQPYFNMRYGVMVLPEIALFGASLVPLRRELVVVGLALAILFSGFNPSLGTPSSLQEPLKTGDWPAKRAQAKWFDQQYHGGVVLIGAAPSTAFVLTTGLPDQDFLNEDTPSAFNRALAAPQQYATWVVMNSHPGYEYDAVEMYLQNRSDWRQYYVLRATIDGVQFYERIGSG
ncbi:MAG: glycosyltransferase family 39 protein [Chloroflexota bacterium]|nr:glycosyltransferase family 39 protein [Chloroflexota bacterium]